MKLILFPYFNNSKMIRQAAVSKFFKQVSKTVKEEVAEDSSAEGNDRQQASTSSKAVSESEVAKAHPAAKLVVKDDNGTTDIPVLFDSSTLPNEMPSR